MSRPSLAAAVLVASLQAAPARCQERPPEERFVSREEYERLKAELEAVKKRLDEALGERAPGKDELERAIEEFERSATAAREEAGAVRPGTQRFLVAGYGTAGFTDREGEDSAFSASLNPVFLWRAGERLLFEAEVEFLMTSGSAEALGKGHPDALGAEEVAGGTGGRTAVDLEYAHLTWVLGDLATLGAGLFLTPFGAFNETLHPTWINKLPDAPLPFGHGGIAPLSTLGLQLRGALPAGSTRIVYALYAGNGPRLNEGEDDPDEAGGLEFDNWDDVNNNKAVVARLGFRPVPALEVGWSVQAGRASASGSELGDVDALLQAVDASYVRDSSLLLGTLDLKAEWAWSRVDTVTYDPEGKLGFGPLRFENRRNGGYAQVAWRPTRASGRLVRNLEGVLRYDALNLPARAPVAIDRQRLTLGLNYWITPSAVVKIAWQLDDVGDPRAEAKDSDALLVQLAMGF